METADNHRESHVNVYQNFERFCFKVKVSEIRIQMDFVSKSKK